MVDKGLFSPISLLLLCTLYFSLENMYYLKTKNQNPKMSQTPKLQCGIFLVYLGLSHPPGYKLPSFLTTTTLILVVEINLVFSKKEVYACSQKERWTNSVNEFIKG